MDTSPVNHFADAAGFGDYFNNRLGPAIAVYRGTADAPHRVVALDHDLADLARGHNRERHNRAGLGIPAFHRPETALDRR